MSSQAMITEQSLTRDPVKVCTKPLFCLSQEYENLLTVDSVLCLIQSDNQR